ncbi:hypothetical protein C8N36_10118 [Pelagimonas varians]|uniref:Uncharacterized protein n=1 Tax=Pelagimonas varians TaxID=696760 RepID=A0A238JVR2_9RHOB|nr:hypothetical protein C8N36_10118 [Pelagimonas varians]SMX34277.1 hypothetical protein PEV8663_00447 [Pelagimonas varians]
MNFALIASKFGLGCQSKWLTKLQKEEHFGSPQLRKPSDASRGATVHDGDADLDLHDPPVKVSCHGALSQQFLQCIFVSCHSTRRDSLPRLGVFDGWNDGVRAMVGYGVMALSGIIGTVCCDACNLFFGRGLVEQVRQDR